MDDKFEKYLRTLELDLNANIDDIKAVYRKLVKIHHPDLYQNSENKQRATKNLKIINNAYDYLINNYIPPSERVFENNSQNVQPSFNNYQKDEKDSLIQLLKQCIANGTKIRIWYKSASYYTNSITERVILPLELYLGSELKNVSDIPKYNYDKNRMYLIAFCELRNEHRMFRVDRILEAEVFKEEPVSISIDNDSDISEDIFYTKSKTTIKYGNILYTVLVIYILVKLALFILG